MNGCILNSTQSQSDGVIPPLSDPEDLPPGDTLSAMGAIAPGGKGKNLGAIAHLVFIDPQLQDCATLVRGVKPGYEAIVLDDRRDGVAQIDRVLQHRTHIQSIHVVCHGKPGSLHLGNRELNSHSLAQYAPRLQQWKNAFSPPHSSPSLLLYACHVAAGKIGAEFLSQLSQLTGLNIAASDSLVGSAAKGGNWQLPIATIPDNPHYSRRINRAKKRPPERNISRFYPSQSTLKSALAFELEVLQIYPFVFSSLIQETFTEGAVVGPWIYGTGNETSATPVLTAGIGAGVIPSLDMPLDQPGEGALRLTSNIKNQATFVIYNNPIPADAGLEISFEMFAYDSSHNTGADGFSLFLIDGNESPTVAGGFGGSLGYAQRNQTTQTVNGIEGGYLGIGFDSFGNFSRAGEGRVGGWPNLRPNAVAIRGRGNGSAGDITTDYPYLTGTKSLENSFSFPNETNRENAKLTAKIILTQEGFLSIGIDFNNDGDCTDEGEEVIPPFDVVNGRDANGDGDFDDLEQGDIKPNGEIPDRFKFGFGGSTGAYTNIHEIRNLVVKTVEPPTKQADVLATKTAPLTVLPNGEITYTIEVTNNGPDPAENVIIFDPLPTDFNWISASDGGTYNPQTGIVSWPSIPLLENGESIAYTITGTAPPTAGTLTNAILATATTFDPDKSNNNGTDTNAIATVLVNTPPEIGKVLKSGTEDVAIGFSSTDFLGQFTDEDNHDLSKIKITSLPTNGTLKLNGQPVENLQEIEMADIGDLVFFPAENFSGEIIWSWNGFDGNEYGVDSGTVQVNLNPVNDPPAIANLTKSGKQNTSLPFSPPDFISQFTDAEGDKLQKIKLTTLPENGTLKLNGQLIELDREIPVAELANLVFTPAENFTGNINFGWNGFDGSSYASTEAKVNVSVAAINNVPEVSAVNKSGNKNANISFLASDFTQAFADSEGDELEKIKITALPENGSLTLNGELIELNQEIDLADLANLVFTPAENFTGNINFGWNGFDGSSYASTEAKVNLSVAAINNVPQVSAVNKSGNKNANISFLASDFTQAFADSEGDELEKIKITALPENGSLTLNGELIELNQEIDGADLANLVFTPAENFTGEINFGWNGFDGSSYAASGAKVNLSVAAINNVPQVSAFNKSGNKNANISFLLGDFTQAFADRDGDELEKIKITALPENGSLTLNGELIELNQEIDRADLRNLVFAPGENFTGEIDFEWNGFDGTSYADSGARVSLTVIPPTEEGDRDGSTPPIPTPPTPAPTPTPPIDTPTPPIPTPPTNPTTPPIPPNPTMAELPAIPTPPIPPTNPAPTGENEQTPSSGEVTEETEDSGKSHAVGVASSELVAGSCGCPGMPILPTVVFAGMPIAPQLGFAAVPKALTLPSFSSRTLFATMENDITFGNGASEMIMGFAGNDLLLGQDGFDRVYGDTGDDTMLGGTGSEFPVGDKVERDRLEGGKGNDWINGNEGNDIIYGGKGDDWVYGGKDDDRIFADDDSDLVYGDLGDDTIQGGNGSDRPIGDRGERDILLGNRGSDLLNGNEGHDTIYAGKDNDIAHGGKDNDMIFGDRADDIIMGDLGDDSLFGGVSDITVGDAEGRDTLYGGEGNDFLNGNENDDWVSAGSGSDRLHGGKDNDMMFGDRGDDTLMGDLGNDTVMGGNGSNIPIGDREERDWLQGNRGEDLLNGNEGNDTIYAGKDNDMAHGGKDDDMIFGDRGDDTLMGDLGDDSLFGGVSDITVGDAEGRDLLYGGAGNDYLNGNENNDLLSGGVGDDTVRGGKNDDLANGDQGNDVAFGDRGNDTLCGSSGDDTLYGGIGSESPIGSCGDRDLFYGGDGNDVIYGNQGEDTLNGCSGNDTLYGGKDNDTLNGFSGDDLLSGDLGNDLLAGGMGSDRFVLRPGSGSDIIVDFADNLDRLALADGLTFEQLAIGQDSSDTLIRFGDELLATLNNVSAAAIGVEDFSVL